MCPKIFGNWPICRVREKEREKGNGDHNREREKKVKGEGVKRGGDKEISERGRCDSNVAAVCIRIEKRIE